MSTQTRTSAAEVLTAGTWAVDPAHSSVGFAIKHLGLTYVRGHFGDFDGMLEIGADGSIAASGSVRAASVDTRVGARDDQLRSSDVFDAERYPEITFAATAVDAVDAETYRIVGDLTMRGVTHEITLGAELRGVEQDPWGSTRIGLEVSGHIDRDDYGMSFNTQVASGAMLLGKKVKVTIDISAVKVS